MTEHDYSAAQIRVLTMEESVRLRPGMYFGVGRSDPRLATRVFCAVVDHAFHPAARVVASHAPDVVAEVTADLAFSVTDDQADTLIGRGMPTLGYNGSLLTTNRLWSAAAAAVSARTVVEVWRDSRGFRQRLVGLRPIEPPAQFSAPAGAGTRVACALDPEYFGPAAITTEIGSFDVHGPYCVDAAGPGKVVIRDRRDQNRVTEHLYT